MPMRQTIAALATAAALTGLPALAHHSHSTADQIAGAIVGAAILGALDSGKHEHHRSYDGYSQPAYNPGAYSPERGVTCYPRQQVCLNAAGGYQAAWTYAEFSR